MAPQERQIRLFVSSTFQDMQQERDELVKRVFPQLRQLCAQRELGFHEVDLRWGITQAQAEAGLIVPICLAEIDGCRPFFLGIIGGKYGTPVRELLPNALDILSERYPWFGPHHLHCSVTELEVRYGVLESPERPHALFYLREAQSAGEPDDARLVDLCAAIERSGHPVARYANPAELGRRVTADLHALIDGLFPPIAVPDETEREEAAQRRFAAERSDTYIGRQLFFAALDRHVAGDGSPLVVVGPPGVGKSALLASWLRARSKGPYPGLSLRVSLLVRIVDTLRRLFGGKASPQGGEVAVAHFTSASVASTSWAMLARRVMAAIKVQLDLPLELPERPGPLRHSLLPWLQVAAERGRVLLVLDGLDQLEDREQALDLGWLPAMIPSNVRLIVSTSGGPSLAECERRGWRMLAVPSLGVSERRALATAYLYPYRKSLDAGLLREMTTAAQTASPLYLRVLLEELRIFGRHENLAARLRHYMAAPTVQALYSAVLDRLALDYEGQRPGLVAASTGLLWAARRGLSESELLCLLGEGGLPLPAAIWSPLYLAMREALVSRSGLLAFAHDALRDAVAAGSLADPQRRRALHRRLADYFSAQPIDTRVIEELPWHLAALEDWPALAAVLGNPAYLGRAWRTHQLEVRSYCAMLERVGVRADEVFATLLARPAAGHASWAAFELLADGGYVAPALCLGVVLEQHARRAGDAAGLQAVLGMRAALLGRAGDTAQALSLLHEQEALCRATGQEVALAACFGSQGALLRRIGSFEAALARFVAEEAICRRVGDLAGLGACLGNQAALRFERGETDAALALLCEQEELCRQLGDVAGLQRSLGRQGLILRGDGQLARALALQTQAATAQRHIGDLDGLQESLGLLALTKADFGDYDGALALLEEREELCRRIGATASICEALLQRAELYGRRLKQSDIAAQLLDAAAALAQCQDLAPLLERIAEQRKLYGPASSR